MVRKTLYDPDRAQEFLERSERKWKRANQEDAHPIDKCEDLQVSMEQALKALIVAQGRHVEHKHDLNQLWDQAESYGERMAATQARDELDTLSLYAGKYQYENPRDGAPEKPWETNRTTGRDVLNHALARVPTLTEETRQQLRGGETV